MEIIKDTYNYFARFFQGIESFVRVPGMFNVHVPGGLETYASRQ